MNKVHFEKDDDSQEIKEEVYICGECSQRFDAFSECEKHVESHVSKC